MTVRPARRIRWRAAVRGLRLLGVYVARFEVPVLVAAVRGRARSAPDCGRLLARLSHRLFTDGFRRAGLVLDTSDGLPLPAAGRPVVAFLRHAGPLNFHLAALVACHVLERDLLSVGRSLPGRDPAVGILVRPLKVELIRWDRDGPVRAMRMLIVHSRDLAPREVLAYFPEGVSTTAAARRRVLADLDRTDPARARWARRLRYVLPPVRAGAARVLAQAKDADVLVVAHTGLEDLLGGTVDLGYPPRADPDDHRVHLAWWHTRAEDVPREPAAAADWLDAQWASTEEWIARKRGVPAEGGGGRTEGSSDRTGRTPDRTGPTPGRTGDAPGPYGGPRTDPAADAASLVPVPLEPPHPGGSPQP
ncbi:hypothetical protein ACQPZG_02750 (plasmid) [Streptomyces sp. CA-294286]|uniref:hypothetical protein n=1 Tax=Streptomyces sp. CA-294286 TaxID=3240070 RepID=UPI003D8C6271